MKKYIGIILILLLTATVISAQKKVKPISNPLLQSAVKKIGDIPSLSAVDICIARLDDSTRQQYFYDGWVIGQEMYFNYIDPERVCNNPYPYTVNEVHFYLHYSVPLFDTFSVFFYGVDDSDPNCKKPDNANILYQSNIQTVNVTDTGTYDLNFTLNDRPVVDGPFFAAVLMHVDYPDTLVIYPGQSKPDTFIAGPDILTDTYLTGERPSCESFNFWSDTLVALDTLTFNGQFAFLGRLLLYASGEAGGYPGNYNPPPKVRFVSPNIRGGVVPQINKNTELWAQEFSGSRIIDSVSFFYLKQGSADTVKIATDIDGYSPLRNGLTDNGSGDGYAVQWDISQFSASSLYTLIAKAVDTSLAESLATVNAFVVAKAPTPVITSPAKGSDFCDTLKILFNNPQTLMDSIRLFYLPMNTSFSVGLATLNQSNYGDANGNSNDGNLIANGEYGEYYNAPIAAALAIKLWQDRTGQKFMVDQSQDITIDSLVEILSAHFKTKTSKGTYDENFYLGIINYLNTNNILSLRLEHIRKPSYFDIRQSLENENKAALLGLGGNPCIWFAVDGFRGWLQDDASYFIRVSHPITGVIEELKIRNTFLGSEIFHNDSWQRVDIIVTLDYFGNIVTRTYIGVDSFGADGWAFDWEPAGLIENNKYYFHAIGHKGSFNSSATILLNYYCPKVYVLGDYDDDGDADIEDFTFLQAYIINTGVPVEGGAFRADANGDNNINIADLIYYLNYLFGNVSEPSY